MKIALVIAVVLATGCPGKTTTPPAPASDCDDVGAHAEQLLSEHAAASPSRRDNLAGIMVRPPTPAEEAATYRDECLTDHWSQAAIDCYVAAPSVADGRQCVLDAAPSED